MGASGDSFVDRVRRVGAFGQRVRAAEKGATSVRAHARALVGALVMATLTATLAFAVQPDEVMKDPALEARARALSAELRCMVCQNQSIDDSDAALARDIRLLIRERIAGGESNEQVRAYLT